MAGMACSCPSCAKAGEARQTKAASSRQTPEGRRRWCILGLLSMASTSEGRTWRGEDVDGQTVESAPPRRQVERRALAMGEQHGHQLAARVAPAAAAGEANHAEGACGERRP